jgi:hypothetical protein
MAAARMTGRLVAAGVGLSALGYGALAAMTWNRYGRTPVRHNDDDLNDDELIDRFIPAPEVEERHAIRVAAAAEDVFEAACSLELDDVALVRGIFRVRELAMGSGRAALAAPAHGLLAQVKSIGWGVLAEIPGREIVFGAVTRPWEPHPVFRAIPPAEFAAFDEPGYVKIAWTLRADATGERTAMARTVTRAATTDARARRHFRRYWSAVMPGVVLIRLLMLRQIKLNAERAS